MELVEWVPTVCIDAQVDSGYTRPNIQLDHALRSTLEASGPFPGACSQVSGERQYEENKNHCPRGSFC
jgi:hypothetical protein